MAQQLFKPEHMARGIIALYPEMAHEIAFSLMNDAMSIGESVRAQLWWDVMVRIGRMQNLAHRSLH